MLQHILKILVILSVCHQSYAELSDLTESELSGVTGEGIGLVYESYQLEMLAEDLNARDDGSSGTLAGGDTGNDFKITGIVDDLGAAVDVSIAQYYFAGTGTNLGTDLDGKLVNIGRLNNPITIDLLNGNDLGDGTDGWADKAVLSIAMPTHVDSSIGYDCTALSSNAGSGTCSSRPSNADSNGFHGERFDMGYRINRQFTNTDNDVNLNFHAVSANMDGSYIRLWGNADGDANQAMNMEIQMNFYANELVFNSCDLDGANCGEEVGFKGFFMELALGDAKYYQPMTLEVSNTGFLEIRIQALPSPGDSRLPAGTIGSDGLIGTSTAQTWNWFNDYYTNGRKTNISVAELTVGSSSFGSASLQGLQIQYLEVISHEL